MKVFWSPQDRVQVLNEIVRMIRSQQLMLNLGAKRVYGFRSLVEQAQKKVLPPEQRRPLASRMSAELIKQVRAALNEPAPLEATSESSLAPAPSEETESAVPNRLGLNPKFAEAFAYIAQEMVRAFGEALGDAIGKQVRDAIYDVRHHLGTPASYIGREQAPAPNEVNGLPDHGELPERLHEHKVLIVGLRNDQRTIIINEFPQLKFRFCDAGTPSTQVKKVAEGCVRVFATKWTNHSDTTHVPREKLRRVSGGMTELRLAIIQAFPNTFTPPRVRTAA